jgi:DNA repair protein RadC
MYVRTDAAEYRPATPEEIFDAARQALSRKFRRGCALNSMTTFRDYLRPAFAGRDHEVFCVVLLDAKLRLLKVLELFRGTVDSAGVYPREVVKEVLAHNATSVILVHNHPSGVAEPSTADELMTRKLREALLLIDVRVLDHLVIGSDQVVSMAERGLL